MPHRCIPLLRQTGFRGALFLALAAGALAGTARAEAGRSVAAEQAFVEQGVDVDVTAGNANQARDQAILQAQREALARLFRKLTPAADGRQPPAVSQGELEALVAGFELEQERASSVRYVGRFTVRFRPAAVRQLLQQNGVRYAEMVGKPALVLPVDATGAEPALWTDGPWRQAWSQIGPVDGLVPVALVPPDPADQNELPAKAALTPDATALAHIAARHGAGQVVVARLEGDAAKGYQLTLSTFVPGEGLSPAETVPQSAFVPRPLPVATDTQPPAAAAPPPLPAALGLAVATVVDRVEEGWKRRVVVDAHQSGQVAVRVPLTDLTTLVEVRRRLAGVPMVTQVDTSALKTTEALLTLTVLGDVGHLKTALAQRDLVLSDMDAAPAPTPGAAPAPASATPAEVHYQISLAVAPS
ncbi:DUF2066 domain-containing protein [Nitrospirillum viridazoti]|uniref:DUF2066 domain-containing protein n=1 Tax=Nitrospirillum viridazoti CBAmc TaxID=1441467 RepID=A0A248JVU0_9PROT|nr:DUF2066 domain-containing protein [Nitrospirillum amazonense]ASG22601.1 hypothetical protein Y958_16890 [Nitrospirillum amazonense CBAmc]TWB42831.1 uncharacterized protein DUF2066 [Nitrospirillum amazonense]